MGSQRILFITPNFPPFAQAGAARTGALALHWAQQGHEVTVLGARIGAATGIHSELDHPNLTTIMLAVDKEGEDARPAAPAKSDPAKPAARPGKLKRWLWLLRQMPDRFRAHWVPRAVAKARKLGGADAFDLIYSSGPPHSAHIAAQEIAQETGLKWVCEQRDLWVENPYIERHPFLTVIYERQGRRVQQHASAIVAVTRGAARELERQTGKPVTLARNGWEESDFAHLQDAAKPLDPERLTIIHAGLIYAERRDPKALFEAIALLGEDRRHIRAIFYHDEYGFLGQRIAQYGVEDCVEVQDFLPRSEILRIERQADVLLMCRWPDPAEDAVIPGKLFEYIGARRPILATGLDTGEAAEIVREGEFGIATQDAALIAERLREWIAQKQAGGGRIADLPAAPARAYTRDTAFAAVDKVIEGLGQE
ncbi:glycosyltransferase [Qipengyuania psychrotolerans]|uniref:Glycosyltransferase n=1 Tax=Qipengyuania psychrotolerans TaxID=2867238 RepID=A0ABX8ZF76_9SPHN|nr:glycosyltransferase [Qipengyuania psychrotolerans]QZD86839.1 glycosyltransferase [Qipengyuania psychrotolerans]